MEQRKLDIYTKEKYDLIIVGGGVYGLFLSLESAKRGLKSIMIEKNDFFSATSLNHLRTVHGGLRYLQSADLLRFKESVGERKWFFKYLPEYTDVMPCLMPLYNKGVQRTYILKAGLLANDILSFYRNSGVEKKLPGGYTINKKKCKEIFPSMDDGGLKGGAVWFDGRLEEYQRTYVEIMMKSKAKACDFINYCEAKELITDSKGQVQGVKVKDKESDKEYLLNANIVINVAGPWCREISSLFDKDYKELFPKRLLLWNVLFDKKALSTHALGISPGKGKGHTYFFHPWKGRLLVGTGEELRERSDTELTIKKQEMEKFINDINIMAPGLNLSTKNILRVYPGILPANDKGKLANREKIIDHSKQSKGIKGLFSVSGVKFTTARLVSEKVLNLSFPASKSKFTYKELLGKADYQYKLDYNEIPNKEKDIKKLKEIIKDEQVIHLSDLFLRRTTIGDNILRINEMIKYIDKLFPDWNQKKIKDEIDILEKDLQLGYEYK